MKRPILRSSVALLTAAVAAQAPADPPPWWGVQDEVTVSLQWDFDNGAGSLPPQTPDFQVAASWYQNPQPWSASGAPLQFLGQFQGRVGVFALVGNGTPQTASLDLFVDNDPHLNWVKTLVVEYKEYDQSGGDLTLNIKQQLSQYGRAAVTEERVALANGWDRVTLTASLIPQPDDEEFEWLFEVTGNDTVAIDDVTVTTRCVKPIPDETGDALGKVTSNSGQPVNLTAATGRTCRAAAVTRPPQAGAPRRLWVAALSAPGQPHELLELDPNTFSVVNSVPLLTLPSLSPTGPMDMAVETRFPQVGPPQEWVFTLLRTAAGDLAIDAVDVQSGAVDPARSLLIPAANGPFAANQRLGLAFDPDGDGGLGSFWITGQTVFPPNSWRAFEFPATGATSLPLDDIGVPPETVGFTYDETLGNFYAFSRTLVQSPSGSTSRVNGAEISAYNFQQTGVRFCGDLTIPNPQGPAGGVAGAISMYRTFGGNSSEARFVCVANVGPDQFYYELAGPYRYGYSRYGRLGMENGPPFVGGTFDITLSGVPNSLLAAVFLGGSANNLPIGVEAYVSVNSFSNIGPLLPTSPGKFRIPINVPPNPSLAYFELFAQCVVLDGTAPGFLGYTQAGKTVIYP